MQLNEKEDFFLKCYKGEFLDDNLVYKIFSDINNYPKKKFDLFSNLFPNLQDDNWWKKSLEYENINNFLNFINNPNNNLHCRNVNLAYFDGAIEMIKTLIELACKNGIIDDNDYLLNRYENVNNLENYKSIYLTSFKSTTTKSISSGEIDFAKKDSVLVKYNIKNFCPHITVDKLISSVMNDESEILFPPFLNCEFDEKNSCYNVFLPPNYDYDLMKLLYEFDENNFNSIKEEFGFEFIEFQKTGTISSRLKELCSVLSNYLMHCALIKYQEYYLVYKDDITKKLVK